MKRWTLIRLVIEGSQSSRYRLAGMVAGTMIGVTLFLLLVSAYKAFPARNLRSTWIEPAYADSMHTPLLADMILADDEVGVIGQHDVFAGQTISVLQISITTNSTVVVPGVDRVPHSGEYVASPALARLIDSVPSDQLGQRYGTRIGEIADDALEGPDSLVAVIGVPMPDLTGTFSSGSPEVVTQLNSYDYASGVYKTIAIIGAIAVLVPILLLVASVTDLGNAQRTKRFQLCG